MGLTLAPLLAAAPAIRLHAVAAMAAFVLGLVQFARPKGAALHRALGWAWAGLMLTVALSSFWIHTIGQFGPFSLIHLLSLYVLAVLPFALLAARRHHVRRHQRTMVLLFLGALVIAGAFTLWPGRIMHEVVFG